MSQNYEVTTTDLSALGYREHEMLEELLKEMMLKNSKRRKKL